jgi:hypothetical protein
MTQIRTHTNESEDEFYNRIREKIMIDREKDMLDFFRRRPGIIPDGSFMMSEFWRGYETAKRKFNPKKGHRP